MILVVLRMPEGRCFRIGLALEIADIGMFEDVETLGIGGHQPVFDAVMHHFDEMPCARRAAMQVTLLGRAFAVFPPGHGGYGPHAGCQGLEYGIQPPHWLPIPADHEAVATIQTSHPAAGADIQIMHASLLQFAGPANIVDVIGVAAVDEDIAGLEMR